MISQNDCENALPILVSVWKSKATKDNDKLLRLVQDCSEKTQNYKLKASSENLLLKKYPADEKLQMSYLDSLFFLSKFKNVLSYTADHPQLKIDSNYWILRARSFFEVGQTEKAIDQLVLSLKVVAQNRRAVVYYWLGQFYSYEQDYDMAIVYYKKARAENYKPNWLLESINDLIVTATEKNKKIRALFRFRYGYDSNILRESIGGISDSTHLVDISLDYDYIKKMKKSLNFGLDYNYQGYQNNSSEQTASFAPRVSQSFIFSESWSFDYMISVGKVLTNNKADQNYFVAFSQLSYKINSDIEIQNSLSLFSNLNNNPVKQIAVSSILNLALGTDYIWIGPTFKQSDSPEVLIDAVTYGYPVISDYSLTTRYSQLGFLMGYIKSISDSYSLQIQYGVNQTKYVGLDLSPYDPAQVEGDGQREDIYQSSKLTLKYRYSQALRFDLSGTLTQNRSKGFQGFYFSDKPSNSYDQSQVLLGLTYRWP